MALYSSTPPPTVFVEPVLCAVNNAAGNILCKGLGALACCICRGNAWPRTCQVSLRLNRVFQGWGWQGWESRGRGGVSCTENSIGTYRSWQPRAGDLPPTQARAGVLPDVQTPHHLPGCHSGSESLAPYERAVTVQGIFSVFSLGSRGTCHQAVLLSPAHRDPVTCPGHTASE